MNDLEKRDKGKADSRRRRSCMTDTEISKNHLFNQLLLPWLTNKTQTNKEAHFV